MKAVLMLEDGKSFFGEALNNGEAIGEVILNTAVVGYQEMLTDPANAGKILVLTYPLIGNYGVASKFNESKNVWLAGLAIKENSRMYSNWQAKGSFEDFVKGHNLPLITEVDTRTLAVHLRQKGQMLGVISTRTTDPRELLTKISEFKKKSLESILPKISVTKPIAAGRKNGRPRIAILDLGITNSILRQLEILGLSATLFPYKSTGQEILRSRPKGLIISNGPEEDPALKGVVANIKPLIRKLPILGISTGHQVLAQALGAKLNKLKLGHRGVNYPMHHPTSYKGEITAQNHAYVVDTDSLSKVREVKITAFNLNDRTVEEMESKKLKIFGIQYYPACPGFNEANSALVKFKKMLTKE